MINKNRSCDNQVKRLDKTADSRFVNLTHEDYIYTMHELDRT